MKCDDYQPLIEEYFDRELDETAGSHVRHHLDTCRSCSTLLQSLAVEQEIYSNYKPDVEITRDLWLPVRKQIATAAVTQSEGWFQRLGASLRSAFALPRVNAWTAATLVISAVGLTVAFMSYLQHKQDSPKAVVSQKTPEAAPATQAELPPGIKKRATETSPETVVESGGGSKGKRKALLAERRDQSQLRVSRTVQSNQSKTPNQLVREAEQKYLAAIVMLSHRAERKRSGLDAETRASLDQALSSIDRTIAGTRQAVRRHPQDPLAVQYMLTAYAKKVDVLRQIVDDY